MIELTAEQQAQHQTSGWPPHVVNPATGERFVLIHVAMFERARRMLEAEDGIAEIEETYGLVSEVLERRRIEAP